MQSHIQACIADPTITHPYQWTGELLLRKGKIVIGQDPDLRKDILLHYHDSAVGGHSGTQATYKRINQTMYWKGLKNDVYQHLQACLTCQQHKGETVATPSLLQPIPIPDKVWTKISMDFIVGLPNSHGKTTILVVVDRLSKAAQFIALAHPYTASTIAQAFLDSIYKLHGFPKSIITDRDPIFLSAFRIEFFKLQKVHLHPSTAYHKTDGHTEVVNRGLECYLRCFVSDRPKEWSSLLPLAEYWYNTSFHTTIQATPYEIVYGQPSPSHVTYSALNSSLDLVDRSLHQKEATINLLKHHLCMAQNKMKVQADKKRSERTLTVGDWAYVKLQPYRQA